MRDALQSTVDKQKENPDNHSKYNMSKSKKGDRVLLLSEGLRDTVVTNLGAENSSHASLDPFEYSR